MGNEDDGESDITLGHPLHSSTLAYVFKVVHMKGRGGSGEGRVAFARVYSGTLKARDSVRVISPGVVPSHDGEGGRNNNNGKKQKHPVERIGGMLELSGGQFGNMPDGSCRSGDVCALVGLKGVVTGDTLLSVTGDGGSGGAAGGGDGKKKSAKKTKNNDVAWKQYMDGVHLAGLTSPKPVLTLRVEAYSTSEQSRLSAALALLAVEDPSLVVEETPTTTLISGLGELHMEIVLDRLRREFGLEVRTGKPAVAYRETVLLKDGEVVETDGLVEYDRTVGGVRLQGAVQLLLRQSAGSCTSDGSTRSGNHTCRSPEDPVVTLSPETRSFFNLDPFALSDDLEHKYPPAMRALLSGVRGSMKRGRLGPYPLANLECRVVLVDSELSSSADTLPGAMRAAAANAVATMLETLAKEGRMTILEPKMNVEIWVPTGRVGDVLSDLTGRRGMVDDVAMADEGIGGGDHVKSMVRAEIPLVEILGYANSLRSLTGGEGAFSAEYKGHAPKDGV
jgi:elongation factor G